ncbi:MAG: glycosyltransferase family 10 [Pseudomonadota bacterium]
MKKSEIRVAFSDFWIGFNEIDNPFVNLLKESFAVILDKLNPEILIFSCFGSSHLRFDCTKIFYTGENIRPDFNLCDYAIGFDHLTFSDRYLRFPVFALDRLDAMVLSRDCSLMRILVEGRGFCNFIYSNSRADPIRDDFFRAMNGLKKVDSLGRHLRNVQTEINDRESDYTVAKVSAMSNYNFTIAFENSGTPGYTTEKITHAFIANTIPIYWGDPDIKDQFNEKAFINLRDFESINECAEFVNFIASDTERIVSYLVQPPFVGQEIPETLQISVLKNFLVEICLRAPEVRKRCPSYGRTALYLDYCRATERSEARRSYLRFIKGRLRDIGQRILPISG